MAQAKEGDLVKVHYTGNLEDGTEFDSSSDKEPLEFTIGKGEVIPGFEQAVSGMSPGESKTVTVPPGQAYGQHKEEMVAVLERKDVPADIELAVGNHLEVSQENGDSFPVMVTDLSDTAVTLDANHPLAGKSLVFKITLLEVA
jgi:peptidylprolyl isomerase